MGHAHALIELGERDFLHEFWHLFTYRARCAGADSPTPASREIFATAGWSEERNFGCKKRRGNWMHISSK
jgi:hypothetical protein